MQSINLQKWALAAEIIGGIAVVVSLIFLIMETRENTNAVKAQTYQILTSELNEIRRELTEPNFAELVTKVRNGGIDSLNETERYRMIINSQSTFAVYESAYYSYQRGTLGEDEWERYFTATCRTRDGREWGPIATNLSVAFRDYVDSECELPE